MQGELELKAQVLPFPPSRRIERVRVVAGMLDTMKAADATKYWKRTMKAMERGMKAVGVSQERVDKELHAFFDAVQQELIRRTYAETGSGGAA